MPILKFAYWADPRGQSDEIRRVEVGDWIDLDGKVVHVWHVDRSSGLMIHFD